MGLIRHHYPNYPTTQPLGEALRMHDAGHFVIPDPVMLDQARGVLFVTREDALPTAELLTGSVGKQTVILTRERPVFAHWALDETREWLLSLVVPGARPGTFELVNKTGHRPIGGKAEGYQWSRAFSMNGRIYVPTKNGVSVFEVSEDGKSVTETPSPPLVEGDGPHAPAVMQLDLRGLLAWVPPTGVHPGSQGAARFVEGKWVRLSGDGWPDHLMHMLPLPDGNVLQLVAGPEDSVRLNIMNLDPVKVDEQKVIMLIADLSDPDPGKRDRAFQQLANYGPGIWPIAERLMENEPPETQSRLKDLLKAKTEPFLGGHQVLNNKLRVVTRTLYGAMPDAGVLLYAPDGIAIPRGDMDPLIVSPAWLYERPGPFGPMITRLDPDLVADLLPDKQQFVGWNEEWLVIDDVHGPRRYFANELVPMLRKKERVFSQSLGMDGLGRFIFRKPPETADVAGPTTTPSTRPATRPLIATAEPHNDSPTLIIDPTLPDPRPRMPIWQVGTQTITETGWNKDNWPVIRSSSTGALGFNEWKGLDDRKEPFYTTADQVAAVPPYAPATRPVSTRPATNPTTQASTEPVAQLPPILTAEEAAKPLLKDSEGNWYFGGVDSLKVVRKDGTYASWPLPATAQGQADYKPWLVRSEEGFLFLFNQPGRLVRIRVTPDDVEPFKVDATYARNIPNTSSPTRIWLDPFDRIAIAYDKNKLTILFPRGFIPRATLVLIPGQEIDEAMDVESQDE
jgi:hypothetical protein